MIQIVIKGKYYKDKSIFNLDKARYKKESVWFVDRDKYSDYVVDHMSYSDLQKLRLNIFNKYYKLVKYTPFSESDVNGNVFEGYDLESPIIEIDNDEFARLIPNRDYRRKFFVRDAFRERYYYYDKFINFVNINVI